MSGTTYYHNSQPIIFLLFSFLGVLYRSKSINFIILFPKLYQILTLASLMQELSFSDGLKYHLHLLHTFIPVFMMVFASFIQCLAHLFKWSHQCESNFLVQVRTPLFYYQVSMNKA